MKCILIDQNIELGTLLVLKTTYSYLQLELSQCALSLLSCRQTSRGGLCSGTGLVIGEWRPAWASFNHQGT